MFGMGFMEIMIIAVIAVIFLGPDKLPETMVNIAKFFRSTKATLASAKDSIEQEMNISELKQEALSYKDDLMSASNELERVTSMASLDDDFDLVHDTSPQKTPKETSAQIEDSVSDTQTSETTSPQAQTVTFEKKNKKTEEEDNA